MKIDKGKYIALLSETKQKIGAVTYIVAAHFHEEQDDLKTGFYLINVLTQ